MRIEKALKEIHSSADGWVRLDEARWLRSVLVLSFGIHKGKRGGRSAAWALRCDEVCDAKITGLDGGGLRLYPTSHPAARQFVAPQTEVRWHGVSDELILAGALYKAHTEAVGDWIPFDSYSSIRAISKDKFSCRGPEFLMRAYADALRAIGKTPQLALGRRYPKEIRPRVLHFGDSYVVATRFTAERLSG